MIGDQNLEHVRNIALKTNMIISLQNYQASIHKKPEDLLIRSQHTLLIGMMNKTTVSIKM